MTRDERARKLIENFDRRMRRLAGGSIPSSWLEWTVDALKTETLAEFTRRYLGKRKPGRPVRTITWRTTLRVSVDAKRAELRRSGQRKVTTKAAIREWILESHPSIGERELAKEASAVAKDYSRSLPPQQRRKKTDARLLRSPRRKRLPADWLNRLARGEKL